MKEFKIELPQVPDRTFDITHFGAIGDGNYNNQSAINEAILVCSNAGGGKVVIPAGIWLTGPIQFQSNVQLHLDKGAFVQFSKRFEDYPLIKTSYEGYVTVRCQSPIDGEGLNNIAITGEGVIDGRGDAWRPVKRYKLTPAQWEELTSSGGIVDEKEEVWWPTEEAMNGNKLAATLIEKGSFDPTEYEPIRSYLRPNLLSLRSCQRILLEGVTFQNSPAWNLHPWASKHITIRNVTVRNPWYSQNGDGLDIDSCRYVEVAGCSFDVGDDAICLKSGKDKAGRELGLPCEFVRIHDCYAYHGHGGFVIGSEMSGGVRHIEVSNCLFMGTDIGLRFKSVRGSGGTVEDINISNIHMVNIIHEAISFHLFYEGKSGSGEAQHSIEPVTEKTPIFRNIKISNVTVNGAHKALLVNGLAEMPVKQLDVENFKYSGENGIECTNLCDSTLSELQLNVRSPELVTLNHCNNVIYSYAQ